MEQTPLVSAVLLELGRIIGSRGIDWMICNGEDALGSLFVNEEYVLLVRPVVVSSDVGAHAQFTISLSADCSTVCLDDGICHIPYSLELADPLVFDKVCELLIMPTTKLLAMWYEKRERLLA